MDLHDTIDDAIGHVGAVEFGHAGFVAVIQPLVGFPRGVKGKPFRGLDFCGGVGEHPLDGLTVGDGLAKGDALPGVVYSHL